MKPSDEAVPGKDTINRRNRMKLRCVRGRDRKRGERERAGGGESDRARERNGDCDANIPPDIPLHLTPPTGDESVCTVGK